MNTTTEALEPELERPAAADAPVRFEYDTRRTLLIVRGAAGVLALPFLAALLMRSTGVFALAALLLALVSAWLLVEAQLRLMARPSSVTVSADGLSLAGRTDVLRWSDITIVQHSRVRGCTRFGTRMNPRVMSVDADLTGYAAFMEAAIRRIDASRRGEDPPRQSGRGDALFRRSNVEDLATSAASLAGVMLGLIVSPAYFALTAIALPRLLWHWLSVPSGVAVDDTAVWIIRPFRREAAPLRAMADVHLRARGVLPDLAVVIERRDTGEIPIRGLGAATLPLFDAVVAARMRARIAARTGPAVERTGSAIRRAGSSDREMRKAGAAVLAVVVVAWITVLTGVPLRTAARLGNSAIARAAIMLRSPVDFAGRDGFTALHHAASGNHAGIARALLDRGANASMASGPAGLTPLHVAAQRGHREVLAVLVERGADVNARSAAGRTPLAYAALADAAGDPEIARMLVDAGADPALADDDGRTPLHHAAINGHALLIRGIGRAISDAIEAVDTTGQRALHAAAAVGHHDAAAALIDAGADVNARGRGGRTAVAEAAAAGAPVALVHLLLEGGARVAVSDDEGWNAVQLAVRENNVEVLELFARSRAPLNATDGRVAPALWLAADRGSTEAARALLRGGASPYVRWGGRRAVDVARANRNATLLALMQMR